METVEKWSEEEARKHRDTARFVFTGDEYHNRGTCRHVGQTERMSCGVCALEGYEPRGGWEDDYSVKRDGPNYAGWGRMYVEAGRVIPEDWREAFEHQASEGYDNQAYAGALRRSVATFGVRFSR